MLSSLEQWSKKLNETADVEKTPKNRALKPKKPKSNKGYLNLDKKLRKEIEDIKDRFEKRWRDFRSSVRA